MEIFLKFTRDTKHQHPHLFQTINNYADLLMAMGDLQEVAAGKVRALAESYGVSL